MYCYGTDLSVGALPEWLNEDAGLRVNNTCLTEKTCKCEVRRSESIKDCTCCERVECPD